MSVTAIRVLAAVAIVIAAGPHALTALPKCHQEATALPDVWQEILAPSEDITFALPPGFAMPENQPAFMHCGALWSGPGIEVKVSYGMWGMSSFKLEDADRVCQTQINGIAVVLIVQSADRWNSMTAWMQTKADPFEPVLSVSFLDWDDVAVARHIIGSMQRAEKQ